jgi:hypothetical protein
MDLRKPAKDIEGDFKAGVEQARRCASSATPSTVTAEN